MVLKKLSELYVVLHKSDAKGTEFSVQKVHLNNRVALALSGCHADNDLILVSLLGG